jgi:hypothetical protein
MASRSERPGGLLWVLELAESVSDARPVLVDGDEEILGTPCELPGGGDVEVLIAQLGPSRLGIHGVQGAEREVGARLEGGETSELGADRE